MNGLSVYPVCGLKEVVENDDLSVLMKSAIEQNGLTLQTGDILVVGQKIVSKAEGRRRALRDVMPGPDALLLARGTGKDARLVALILEESNEVLRWREGLIIVQDKRGLIMANAGIDQSNTGAEADMVVLLPEDPSASAKRIRQALEKLFCVQIGVLVIDSFGRPWRIGVTGVVIGASGVETVVDARGRPDRDGRPLQSTQIGAGDALAAAAALVMGEGNESVPAAIVRGWYHSPQVEGLGELLRPREADMFR